jgi:seryl-tRNA synthetase
MKLFNKNKTILSNQDTNDLVTFMSEIIKINNKIHENFKNINPNDILKDVIGYNFNIDNIKSLINEIEKELLEIKTFKNNVEEEYIKYKIFNEKIKEKLNMIKDVNNYKKKLEKKEKELKEKEEKINQILKGFDLI